jgi:membrane associated rhomboid family serine protease
VGIYGRDYMRDRPADGVRYATLSVTTRLIVANVVLWFVYAGALSWGGPDGGLYLLVRDHLLLDTDAVFARGRIWQPFTALWFHDPSRLDHVFFNMLFLWFFGRHAEALLGRGPFLRLYLLSGLASTLALVPLAALTATPIVGYGASGAVYGVGVFLALRQPDLPVVFFVVRMPLWVLVGVFLVGREVANLALLRDALGTTVGHLTGAAFGLVFHRLHRGASGTSRWMGRLRLRRPEPAPPADVAGKEVRARVDALLEKIHRDGIAALSDEEKDFLERASARYGR